MKENDFIQELMEIGIELNEKQIKQFSDYADFLLEYNSHTNLTAIRNRDDVYLKHFFDSLLISKFKKFENEKILDIGSGAGFPGVVLKIVYPEIKLTVLDANGKKCKFLEQLKLKLNIEYTVINDRAENYVKSDRETFDIVVSRAVSAMPILSELALPFVKVNGYFIAYKGQIDEKIENGSFAIDTLGGKVTNIFSTNLPVEKSVRTFVFVNKKCKTEGIYPRLFDKMQKKPLQKL